MKERKVKISASMAMFIHDWHDACEGSTGYQGSGERIRNYMARILKIRYCHDCGNTLKSKEKTRCRRCVSWL
jgi:uncharacterized paraquat-inducible protein A